jgi:hypothetical protein
MIPPLAELIARKTLNRTRQAYRDYCQRCHAHNYHAEYKWRIMPFKKFLRQPQSFWWLANWRFLITLSGRDGQALVTQTLRALERLIDTEFDWAGSIVYDYVPFYAKIDLEMRPFSDRLWYRSAMEVNQSST